MELLEIFTLGRVSIRLGGKPVVGFHSRKAEALLIYLVANPYPQPRTKLAEILWEQRSHSQGLSNLRVLIANLRKLFNPYLVITRESIGINLDSAWEYDAANFEAFLHQDQIEAALGLYQGDFLAGFYITGARGFQSWQTERCAYYQQQAGGALRKHIEQLTHRGQYESAIQQAQKLASFDPFDESSQMKLIRLLAANNQRGMAIQKYQAYHQILTDELGIKPSTEITTLIQQIHSGQKVSSSSIEDQTYHLPPYLQANSESTTRSTDIFVGREHELAYLNNYFSQVLEKKGGIVFVTGESGSGKTSLVREFTRLAQVKQKSLLAVTGYCHIFTGSGNPFGPMREILDGLTGDIESRWTAGNLSDEQAKRLWHCLPTIIEILAKNSPILVGSLLPLKSLTNRIEGASLQAELGQYLAAFNQGELSIHQQDHIFQQFADFLIAVSQKCPLLIILEDLQWADPSTIGLLSYLASRLSESQILIVGTYRPAELLRKLDIDEPDLERVLREFKRQFGNIWIDLDHHEPEEDEKFVQAILETRSQTFSQDFVQQLTHHTGGNPLFVIELLKNIQLQHQLFDAYPNSSPIDWNTLPARVEAVIEMRLAGLDDFSCKSLKAASIMGEDFVAEVIARALGKSDELIYQTLDILIKDQALLIEQGMRRLNHQCMTTLRFRHSIFQRYIYNNLRGTEKAELHKKVGLALEAIFASELDKPNDLGVQLAHHFTEAGMNIKASDYLLEIGNQAVQLGAHAEAIQYFRKGLDLLKALPKNRERIHHEISLSLAMYSTLQALKGYADPELETLGKRVKELCAEVDPENPLLSTLYFLRVTHKTSQERQEALRRAKQILDEPNQSDPLLRSLAHWTLGAEMSYRGDFLSAQEHLKQTKNLYNTHENTWSVFLFGHDPGVASRARLAWVLWFLGYPDQAIQESQQALVLAEQLDHSVVLGFAIGIGGVLFNQIRRDAEAAKAWNLKSIQHSESEQMRLFSPGETISRGWVLSQMGQIVAGLEMMENGLAAWHQSSATRHYTQYLGMLAEGYYLAGQTKKAINILEEALAEVESSQECYFEAELHRLNGEALLKESDKNHEKAEACFQRAIRVAQTQHAKSWELRATNSLCHLWYQQGRLAEADQRLSEIYNWFREGYDTPDLLEAKGILAKIHVNVV